MKNPNDAESVDSDKPKETRQFIRKGEVGGYKNELSEEQIKQLDEWIVKNVPDPELRKLFANL